MTIQDKLATANFQLMKADIHIQTMTAEADQLRAAISRLTAGSEAMQEDARNNTATISAMKELLIKAESALTYANWDGEFLKQATAQDVISARDAIRAYMEVK